MAAVEATFTRSTGEKKEFREPGIDENKQSSLKVIHESVLKIQKAVNDALTEVVNEERQAAGEPGVSQPTAHDEDEDDDDEDGEDEDENDRKTDGQPVAKKPKT